MGISYQNAVARFFCEGLLRHHSTSSITLEAMQLGLSIGNLAGVLVKVSNALDANVTPLKSWDKVKMKIIPY